MPLFDFVCSDCSHAFEKLGRQDQADFGKCPECGSKNTEKQVPKFRVGGRGDLRESTLHGCHECEISQDGDPPHSHDHPDSGPSKRDAS